MHKAFGNTESKHNKRAQELRKGSKHRANSNAVKKCNRPTRFWWVSVQAKAEKKAYWSKSADLTEKRKILDNEEHRKSKQVHTPKYSKNVTRQFKINSGMASQTQERPDCVSYTLQIVVFRKMRQLEFQKWIFYIFLSSSFWPICIDKSWASHEFSAFMWIG